MKEMNITVDLSTVYRTLDTLCDKSLVKKINIDSDSRALYEYNRMLHTHYLVCLGCKKITAIKGCPLEDYEKNLAIETDYTIAGHKLDIYGYCPKCRNARSAGGSVK
ncbi:Transcriptional regulator PerR [bioreactor metagenome]|uniref:Transcriptional regulator PerR n=1 Tax=bioreactor metagenome TaxID=1076179 RepID=A0A645AW87_9ZZZZ